MRRVLFIALLAAACGTAQPKPQVGKAAEAALELARLKRDIGKVDKSIDVTKALIGRSKGERYLPDLYFRLAELYIEKSRLVYFRILEEAGADDKTAVVAPEARLLKDQAIGVYRRILAEFPDYEDNDKITFFIAHEYRELGAFPEMIKTYRELVDKYEKSQFRFEAWLILGDYHFDKGEIDQAVENYRAILKQPETYAHNMARYKLAWCFINKDKPALAVDLWEQAARTPTPTEPGVELRPGQAPRLDVRREALRDLAYYYPESRDPKNALPFFQELTTSREEYRIVLERLAKRFTVKTMHEDAAKVYRELVRVSADVERNLEWAQAIYEAAVAAKDLDHADEDVVQLAEVSARYKYWWRASDEDKKVLLDFELLTRDLSTRLHAYAKEKNDERLYARAAKAYEAYLSVFDDSPQRLAMEWNYAEALFEAKRFVKAGRQYEEVLKLVQGGAAPKGQAAPAGKNLGKSTGDKAADTRQAMYSAILAYFEALKIEEKGTRFDSMMAREGIKDLGARFVAAYPADPNAQQVKFNVARAYYEQGEFARAIELFTAFVKEHPLNKDAGTAAELALDAYAQREDFAGLAKAARAFAAEQRLADASFRDRFLRMADQADQEEINRRTVQTDGDVKTALASFIVEKKGTELAAKALYQAFVIAKDRRNFKDMLETGRQLLDDYSNTAYAKDVLPSLAEQALRISQVEQAAAYYEEYARRFPNGQGADDLLEGAAGIRTELGEFSAAMADYERLTTQGEANRRATWTARLALVAMKAGDWRRAEAAASALLDDPNHGVMAGAIAGEAALRAGKADVATQRLSAAIDMGGRGKGTADGPQWLGRAQYLMGEIVRADFDRTTFGSGDDGAVVAQKFQLLQELEGTYVGAIQAGDPEWAMGGLYRVAQAYKNAADFLDSAPAPQGMTPEEEKAYRQALSEKSGPLRKQADEALDACRKKAKELEAFNRFARACSTGSQVDEDADREKARPAGVVVPGRDRLEAKLMENPRDTASMMQLVRAAITVKDHPLAKLLALKALEQDEKNADLHNLLGVAYAGVGDMQSAAASFKKAVKLQPSHQEARANLGALYALYGDEQRAKEQLSKANVDPSSTDVIPQYRQAKDGKG